MKRFVLPFLLVGVIFSAAPVFASSRVALVIGNSDYHSAPLKNPVNDARDMANLLQNIGFEVISRTNVDKRGMLKAVNSFSGKLKRSEIGIFYFAGHGMQVNGHNYLIPIGVSIMEESDVEFEAVDASRIIAKMRDAENPLNIVILDACRNNPFRRSFRASTQGLARMDAPKGTIIAYATSPGSVAEDGEGKNGIFTKHLLDAMKSPNLGIQDIFNVAGMAVMDETDDRQIPWTSNTPIPRYYLVEKEAAKSGTAGIVVQRTVKTGVLKVESTPAGAEVFIDGRNMGSTPLRLENLKPTKLTVKLVKQGFLELRREAEVFAEEQTTLSLNLVAERQKGRLTVRTVPEGGTVRILNIKEKYYPGIELDQGSYHLEVSLSGYETKRQWLDLGLGETRDISVTLEVRQAAPAAGTAFTDQTTGIEFAAVKGGCFMMGQSKKDKTILIQAVGDQNYQKYYSDELPRHEVCVDSFSIGRYEVSVGQWRKFVEATGYKTEAEKNSGGDKGCWAVKNEKWGYQSGYYWNNTGFEQSENYPVACVSYNDVNRFIRWLQKASGRNYRLPTEAEWEYAARGGTASVRFWGNAMGEKTCDYANVVDQGNGWGSAIPCNDGYKWGAPVGSYKPNDYGLHDMLGNVWEWTGDWYSPRYYRSSPKENPKGASKGQVRVTRGGSWGNNPMTIRAAGRGASKPGYRRSDLGFRLVLPAGE